MSESPDPTTEPTSESGGTADSPTDQATGLQHVTVEYDEEITVCTMFPRDRSEAEGSTQWLTATGESFVSLEEAR